MLYGLIRVHEMWWDAFWGFQKRIFHSCQLDLELRGQDSGQHLATTWSLRWSQYGRRQNLEKEKIWVPVITFESWTQFYLKPDLTLGLSALKANKFLLCFKWFCIRIRVTLKVVKIRIFTTQRVSTETPGQERAVLQWFSKIVRLAFSLCTSVFLSQNCVIFAPKKLIIWGCRTQEDFYWHC